MPVNSNQDSIKASISRREGSISHEWSPRLDYSTACERMLALAEEARSKASFCILGCEHPSVLTLGRHASAEAEVQALPDGFQLVKTDRGGQATIHAPGQLMIYPIVDIRSLGLGAREWVDILLSTTEDLMKANGIACIPRDDETGVFTEAGKIAFLGLRIDRGISRHGLSVNVCNDLGQFRGFRVCGIQAQSQPLDRMANWNPKLTTKDMFFQWVSLFSSKLSLTR